MTEQMKQALKQEAEAIKYIANRFLAPGMDNEINDFANYMKENKL